jgi:hypothetical protein
VAVVRVGTLTDRHLCQGWAIYKPLKIKGLSGLSGMAGHFGEEKVFSWRATPMQFIASAGRAMAASFPITFPITLTTLTTLTDIVKYRAFSCQGSPSAKSRTLTP